METISYKLGMFEGPADLLLQLIEKHKIDIFDIPIAELLGQYMQVLDEMKTVHDLDYMSSFLVMASQLILIKSRMLLPREQEDEEDPREPLVNMLLEYRRYKDMTPELRSRYERYGRTFKKGPDTLEFEQEYKKRHSPEELRQALRAVQKKTARKLPPPIAAFSGIVDNPHISVTARAVTILRSLIRRGRMRFLAMFDRSRSRADIVATFLAVLELSKTQRISITEGAGGAEISVIGADRLAARRGEQWK